MSKFNEAPLIAGMRNLNMNGPSQHQYHTQPPHGQVGGGQQWTQGHEEEDEDDDQPLSYQGKSASVRMATDSNPVRSSQVNRAVAPDMRMTQALYESYSQKIYISGYMFKKSDLTVDGKPLGDPTWSRWYVELCGPVLTFWEANEEGQQNTMPQYIHIAEANAEVLGRVEAGRENVFSLNTTGANRYLLDVADESSLVSWVSAIRLSCYEFAKIQEIFTRSYVTRPNFSETLAKPIAKMEGNVQVRFSGSTDWQKYWVVVSDKKEKKFFGKKSTQSRGQMMFYETKKSKSPVFTMVNVIQSYILCPESLQAIDLVDTFKVEGSMFKSTEQPVFTTVLIQVPSAKELVPWIVGTFDTFKLYGRPSHLYDDPLNINALNFGESSNNTPRLFLDLPDVIHQVNVRDETLADNKAKFAGILLSKLQQQQHHQPSHMHHRASQQPMGLIHQIPSGASLGNTGLIHQIPSALSTSSSSPRPNSQRMSTYSSQSSNLSRSPMPPPQQQRAQVSRKIYASDDDSEEEEEEEIDESEDESDDDSVIKPTKQILLPTMLPSEDDGFASSILSGIEKKSASPPLPPSVKPLQQDVPGQVKEEEKDFGLSDTEEEAPVTKPVHRPKPKMTHTQVSISGSDDDDDSEESEEEGEDDSYSGSDDDIPIHKQRIQQQQQQYLDYNDPRMQQQQQQQQWGMYNHPMEQGYYGEEGYEEDGPVIPHLGDHFATQNSLLDTYRSAGASAHDQEDYARATGQPLIQVPNKPPAPRAGLVGMISQFEQEKKGKESGKRFEMERDRMDRERERYMMDQRTQMMQQSMMGQGMMNTPMMYSGMNTSMTSLSGGMNGGMMPMMNSMPMMNMMNQPMMYPGMMPGMMNPGMMNPGMMPMMMDPRMSMMMMQPQFGQYPMWQQQGMFPTNHFTQEEDDEDDDVPLGAKDSSHTQQK